jgi:hypothetical protein
MTHKVFPFVETLFEEGDKQKWLTVQFFGVVELQFALCCGFPCGVRVSDAWKWQRRGNFK